MQPDRFKALVADLIGKLFPDELEAFRFGGDALLEDLAEGRPIVRLEPGYEFLGAEFAKTVLRFPAVVRALFLAYGDLESASGWAKSAASVEEVDASIIRRLRDEQLFDAKDIAAIAAKPLADLLRHEAHVS